MAYFLSVLSTTTGLLNSLPLRWLLKTALLGSTQQYVARARYKTHASEESLDSLRLLLTMHAYANHTILFQNLSGAMLRVSLESERPELKYENLPGGTFPETQLRRQAEAAKKAIYLFDMVESYRRNLQLASRSWLLKVLSRIIPTGTRGSFPVQEDEIQELYDRFCGTSEGEWQDRVVSALQYVNSPGALVESLHAVLRWHIDEVKKNVDVEQGPSNASESPIAMTLGEALFLSIFDSELPSRSIMYSLEKKTISRSITVESDAHALQDLKWDPDGSKQKSSLFAVVAAWCYVGGAVITSVLTAVLNFASRDNLFERLTDMVAVLTALLVSVFGLVKLTSEDPNAIRNTLKGYRVLRTFRDVRGTLQSKTTEDVVMALLAVDKDLGWLDPQGVCYTPSNCTGQLRCDMQVTVADLERQGLYFGESVCVDLVKNTCRKYEKQARSWHITNQAGDRSSEKITATPGELNETIVGG